jgi:protein-S-isoprenylcysteine O-methyltransferase Ste14
MTGQAQALVILLTWGVLLLLYGFNKFLIKDKLLTQITTIARPTLHEPTKPPGSLFSKAGLLFVFVVNIFTIILLFVEALSPQKSHLMELVKLSLPLWANIIGCGLFVLGTIWGFFAMIFNPNYTPLYKLPPQEFILATQGPYKITRHPRYAAEALLNISLFLMTGFWLPLLGVLGWVAMFHQAKAEERYLMALAPTEYGEYRKSTNMFLPITFGKHHYG